MRRSRRQLSGRVVGQSYDAIGWMNSISSGATNYLSNPSFNAAGQALGFTYGNNVNASFGYNDNLQVASLRYSNSTQDLLNLSYDYTTATVTGNNGQIQKVHYYTSQGVEDLTKTQNYEYDAWSRLKTAYTTDLSTDSTWKLAWDYDRFGNRRNQNVIGGTGPAVSLTIDPNTNRIQDTGYAYDAAGNLTNDTFHSYAYDAENRTKTVDSTAATYAYMEDLRVGKVVGSTSTVYIYSGDVMIAEYANGAPTTQPSKEYIYSDDGTLLATVAADGSTTYQHPDQLSTRAETDTAGNLTRSFGHYPFGESWYETGTTSKWQFTTYERDAESGLDYADFRNYSSRLGRFMQQDPLGGDISDPQSLNGYPYVESDPVNLVDPLGLLNICVTITVFGQRGQFVGSASNCDEDFSLGLGPLPLIYRPMGGGGGGGGLHFTDVHTNAVNQCAAGRAVSLGDLFKLRRGRFWGVFDNDASTLSHVMFGTPENQMEAMKDIAKDQLKDKLKGATANVVKQLPTKTVVNLRIPVEGGGTWTSKATLTLGKTKIWRGASKAGAWATGAKAVFDVTAYIMALYQCGLEIPKP